MALEINTRIKITPVGETNDTKLLRALSYDQEPYPDNIYIIEDYNSNYYTVSLNKRSMRFSLYYSNEKWYYITHDSATRQTTHTWQPKECIIEVV